MCVGGGGGGGRRGTGDKANRHEAHRLVMLFLQTLLEKLWTVFGGAEDTKMFRRAHAFGWDFQ